MTLTMNDSKIRTIAEIKEIIKQKTGINFKCQKKSEAYAWVEKILVKLKYPSLSKPDKGTVRAYLALMTGYSRAQVTRLIGQYIETGFVKVTRYIRHQFAREYSDNDLSLLATTDELHEIPNGNAVKTTLGRLAKRDDRYKNISRISVSHIYNLRKCPAYRRIHRRFQKTKPTRVAIGDRRKPQPEGRPGFIRIDSVHQGDRNGTKGVYHINSIDEVTQFEIIGAVERITEEFLLPLLQRLINQYPFLILSFHADNGSEFINHKVADLLNKLLISLTKSRPRHSNDNALAESKNGSIIRKWIGYSFIPSCHADKLNAFYFGYFNHYVNYHRPCAFASESADPKGKIKKRYPLDAYKTPYEKLRSLPNARTYLKKGVSFKKLDLSAAQHSDNEMAKIVQSKRQELFREIFKNRSPYFRLIS